MRPLKCTLACLIVLMLPMFAFAQTAQITVDPVSEKTEMLTIYPGNVAIVHYLIEARLQRGKNTIGIDKLAVQAPSGAVFLQFDGKLREMALSLVTPGMEQLMALHRGKTISLIDASGGRIEGELVSTRPGFHVLRHAEGSYSYLNDIRAYRIVTDTYADEFRSMGKAMLTVDAQRAGRQNLKLFYRTGGLSWEAEHTMVLNEDENRLNLYTSAMVTNNTGNNYDQVRLRLIAGEIRLVGSGYGPRPDMMARAAMEAMAAPDMGGFDRSEAFEYHAFDTRERVTLQQGDRRQLTLFGADGVEVTKKYIYTSQTYGGAVENGRVAVSFEVPNTTDAGLGEPLPGGVARIYRSTRDGVELIGESMIGLSPKGSTIRFSTGNAFDLRVEESMAEQRQLQGRVQERDFRLELHNSKDEDVVIEVVRRMSLNERIIRSSQPHEQRDASTAVFIVPVKADSSTIITFTLRSGN